MPNPSRLESFIARPAARFTTDPAEIKRRITARPSRMEALALFIALGFVSITIWLTAQDLHVPHDFNDYMNSAHGDFSGYYYAYWFLPVIKALAVLPFEGQYLVWSLANIAGVFLAARVFGGHLSMTLLSYTMLYALLLGVMTGIIIGALAIFWWAAAARRWDVAGLALLIAGTKYQLGLPLGLALWLLADVSWRERLRMLILPAAISLLSLIVYPMWPLDVLDTLKAQPPDDRGSISLWQYIGPLALVLWIPVIYFPFSKGHRILMFVAAMGLALPYFQQNDLLALYVMPAGWCGLLANIGYLTAQFGWGMLKLMVFIPVVVYLGVIGLHRREQQAASTGREIERKFL